MISHIQSDIINTLADTVYKTEFVDIVDQPLKHFSGEIEKWATSPERIARHWTREQAERLHNTASSVTKQGSQNIPAVSSPSCQYNMWYKTGEAATCDLIVTGQLVNKHDKRRALLAVTSAHLLLGKDTTTKLVSIPNHRKSKRYLKSQRQKVNIRINRNSYRLKLEKNANEGCDGRDGDIYLDLSNPPMLSYHYFRHHSSNKKRCHPPLYKQFRNDIALLPIEQIDEDKVGNHGQHKFLTEVHYGFIDQLAQVEEPVFVKSRQGKVVPAQRYNSRDKFLGLHLAFILNAG